MKRDQKSFLRACAQTRASARNLFLGGHPPVSYGEKVREAFLPVDGVATVSTADVATSLRCSPPTARRWAAALGITPRPRTGKKGPRSGRIAPHRRRALVKSLESIEVRLLKIQKEIDGTPDKILDGLGTAGDWIAGTTKDVQGAMAALESDPPE